MTPNIIKSEMSKKKKQQLKRKQNLIL
jgi:hypothetical protein